MAKINVLDNFYLNKWKQFSRTKKFTFQNLHISQITNEIPPTLKRGWLCCFFGKGGEGGSRLSIQCIYASYMQVSWNWFKICWVIILAQFKRMQGAWVESKRAFINSAEEDTEKREGLEHYKNNYSWERFRACNRSFKSCSS